MSFNISDEDKRKAAHILGGILGMAVGGAVGYSLGESIGDALNPQAQDTHLMGQGLNEGPRVVDAHTGEVIGQPLTGQYRVHFSDGSTADMAAGPEGLRGEMETLDQIIYRDPGNEGLFEGPDSNFNGILDGDITDNGRVLMDQNYSGFFVDERSFKTVDYFEYLGSGDNPFEA